MIVRGPHQMGLSSPLLDLAGVFIAGVLVGYVMRALVSAKHRARARLCARRHDFSWSSQAGSSPRLSACAASDVAGASDRTATGVQNVEVSPMRPIWDFSRHYSHAENRCRSVAQERWSSFISKTSSWARSQFAEASAGWSSS